MTDDDLDARMHARLAAAGERWRDENDDEPRTSIAEQAVEPDRAAPRRGRGIALVASAAVVAAALVAGGIVTLSHLRGSDDPAAGGRADLVGTVWKLDGQEDSLATLYVSPSGYLVADDECTIVGAQVTTGGGRIDPSKLQIRHRDCIDQYGPRLGDAFAKTLRAKPEYSAKRRTLTIGEQQFSAAPELPRPTIDVPTWDEARWRLAQIKDASGDTRTSRSGLSLRVHDRVLTATDGCNTFIGKVALLASGSGVRVTRTARCPSGVQEASVGAVLTHRFRASIGTSRLTVAGAGGVRLIYRWVPDDPSAIDVDRLIGRTWRLTGVAGDAPAGRATLRFPSTTTYEANDGCRTFSGKASVSDGSAALQGIPRSPDKNCAEPARNQASTIDSFLVESLWSIRDGKLLIGGGGSQAFSLMYVDSDPARLVGRTWTVVRVEPGSGAGTSDAHLVTAFFGRRGFFLKGTCGQKFGTYRLRGSQLTVASTGGRACADDSADAIALVDVLGRKGSMTWTLDDGILTLTRERTVITLSATR